MIIISSILLMIHSLKIASALYGSHKRPFKDLETNTAAFKLRVKQKSRVFSSTFPRLKHGASA